MKDTFIGLFRHGASEFDTLKPEGMTQASNTYDLLLQKGFSNDIKDIIFITSDAVRSISTVGVLAREFVKHKTDIITPDDRQESGILIHPAISERHLPERATPEYTGKLLANTAKAIIENMREKSIIIITHTNMIDPVYLAIKDDIGEMIYNNSKGNASYLSGAIFRSNK